MRRMSLVTRASWLCLLGLALSAGATQAQGPPVLVVYTNKTEAVGMSKNQPIATVQSSDPKVIRVQPVQNDPTKVLVTGLMPGRSRLTFEDKEKNSEVIDVEVVDANLELLRKEFLEQMGARVPGAQLTVQTTAGGVVIGGTVPDQTSLRTVQDAAKNFFGARVTFAMQLPEAVKDRFIAQVQRAIPGSKVNVHIDGGNIIVSGYAPDANSVKAIEQSAKNAFGPETVMAVSVSGSEPSLRIPRVQQVELEVIIAVVNRGELRRMSFNWIVNGPDYFVSSIVSGPLSFANSIGAAATGGAAVATSSGSMNFGVVGDKNSFSAFLDALRTENLAKVLSEPRVITLSGQSAKILSGGEVPVITVSGLGTPNVEYKPFGTEVNFTPVVLENGKIQLTIIATLSRVDPTLALTIQGTAVNGFAAREVRSVVQLEDCQTLAIGGLIQNTIDATAQKIPVLGDIP
jgi:Flp pilus assembly secretin CpaC